MDQSIHTRARQALEKSFAAFPAEEARIMRWSTHFYQRILERLLERYPSLEGKQIMDAGTGRGFLAIAMSILGAEKVYGLDKYVFEFSESNMFQEGGEQALLERWQQHGVTPIVKDVYELDQAVPPASVDVVTNSHVIEHLKAPKVFIDQVLTVLKPGGFLILVTPNYGRLHARLRLLLGKNPKIDLESFYTRGERGFIGHWREYLPSELEDMLRLSGFVSVTSETFCDPWNDIRKQVSPRSIVQTGLHLASRLVPHGQWNAMVIGQKPLSSEKTVPSNR